MAAPRNTDWTRIYVSQRRDAGKSFGDFMRPDGKLDLDAHSKRIPRMPMEHARELLKYWYVAGKDAEERKFGSFSASPGVARWSSAWDRYTSSMQPFAASVLVDGGGAGTIGLSRTAVVEFWDATHALAMALEALKVSPLASDMWWKSVEEAVDDVKAALTSGGSWALLAVVALGAFAFSGKGKRG